MEKDKATLNNVDAAANNSTNNSTNSAISS